MNKKELITLLESFSREDWMQINKLQEKVFKNTDEEVQAQKENRKKYLKDKVRQYAKKRKVSIPEKINKRSFKKYLKDMGAEQFVGNLDKFIEKKLEIFPDIEEAFENTVLRLK